jgi:fructose-specific phosphotransferase system IIC component
MRTIAGILILVALTMPASAQWHGGHGWGGHGFHPGGFGGHWDGGSGFLGGIVGGVIGGLLARPEQPQYVPQWPLYCYNYRSFNPQTGYWVGYDGVPRFCQ